jgi:hypothetical protein
VDGARPAVTGAAAFLGPGEAEVFAEDVEKRVVGLDEDLDGVAVDGAVED